MSRHNVLVFDSGIGGLSVAREIRRALPAVSMIYLADDAGFPYGGWEEAALSDHVVGVIAQAIDRFAPSAVVIACNTASTLVLPPLRTRFSVPFIGTVPAIKPAAEQTRSGMISVLATPGTIRRDYTRALINSFARHSAVRLVGSANLAPLAEARMRGEPVDDDSIAAEIGPAFVSAGGKRTDVVVLACTHYPFLLDTMRRLAPWPVRWIDPAPAIARRAAAVVGVEGAVASAGDAAYLTSGRPWPPPLTPLLGALGLEPAVL